MFLKQKIKVNFYIQIIIDKFEIINKELETNISELERSISQMEFECQYVRIPENKQKLNEKINNDKLKLQFFREQIDNYKIGKEINLHFFDNKLEKNEKKKEINDNKNEVIENETIITIFTLGVKTVGKTSFVSKYSENTFSEDYCASIIIEHKDKC